MNEREQDKSGELTSFLHLTGWRPVVLALIAGIAAAVGLYLALGTPASFVARYNVSVRDVADDDSTPQEISSLAQGIVLDMRLPQTLGAVESETGFVEEEDYEIAIQRSPASTEVIDINVVAAAPETAELIAVETAITGLNTNLSGERATLENKVRALQSDLDTQEARESDLIAAADGLRPDTAYLRAQDLLIARQDFIANPPQVVVTDEDGNPVLEDVPEPSPPIEELQNRVAELEPIDREYQRVRTLIDDLNVRLADSRDSLREINTAITDLADERTNPSVIQRVDTEEASRISSLLTGILLFAIPAALATILLFVIFDLLFRRPDEMLVAADPIDAHGVLDASSQPALPEASVAQLVVVDDDGNEAEVIPDDGEGAKIYDAENDFADADDDADDDDDEDDQDGDDEDNDDEASSSKGDKKKKGKSKESRWGRDAGSKAG